MEDYAPRSPDLSGLVTQKSHPDLQDQFYNYPPPPARNDSFSLGSSSYYQPPPLPYHDSSTAYFHSYEPPSMPKLESQDSWQHGQPPTPPARRPGRPKREDANDSPMPRSDSISQVPTAKSRKPSMKSQRPPQPEPESRPPAPGDAEGIVIKTKFPAARIKRIVQADEEVGKVAQAAPVAVGKALELFMIHLSLAAINEVRARGSKRLLAQHVKTAISKDDTFDFLTDIGSKIPEGTSTKAEGHDRLLKTKPERGTSVEDDMDEDFDDEAPKSTRKRRKRKPAGDD